MTHGTHLQGDTRSVIFVVKSAKMQLVRRPKTQSSGDSSGIANISISSFGSVSLG
jgi:hypothetical protein